MTNDKQKKMENQSRLTPLNESKLKSLYWASKILTKWRIFWVLIIFILIYLSWNYILLIRGSYLIEGCVTKEEEVKLLSAKLEGIQRVVLNKKIADCIHSKQGFFEHLFMEIPIDLERQ